MAGGVFFDLDGTLQDTAPDFIDCVQQLRRELQLQAMDEYVIREQVSNGSLALTALACGLPPDDPMIAPLQQRLLELYDRVLGDNAPLFAGLESALAWLESQQIPWGIITNKPLRYTEPLLAKKTWPFTPSCVICPEHVSQPKPAPDGLLLACEQTGCEPSESWYLGDHRRDIEAGIAAGMQTAMCHWGYLSFAERQQHFGETVTLQTGHDLLPLLQRHFV